MPDEEFYRYVGTQLKQLRTERALSQDALAAQLSLARSTYSGMETGRHRADLAILRRAAHLLGSSLSDLVPPSIAKFPDPNLLTWIHDLRCHQFFRFREISTISLARASALALKRSGRVEFLAWIQLSKAERDSLAPLIANGGVLVDWTLYGQDDPVFSVILALKEATLEGYQRRLLQKYLEGWQAWLQSGERLA